MPRLTVALMVCAVLVAAAAALAEGAQSSLPIARPVVFLPAEQPEFMLDQILVKFKPAAPAFAVEAFNKSLAASRRRVGRNLDFEVVAFPLQHSTALAKAARDAGDKVTCARMLAEAEARVWQMVETYEKSGLVEWARPNYIATCLMTPNDTYYRWPTAWPNEAQPDEYGVIQMNAAAGWDVSTGEDVVIVLTDSGLDLDHPDIAANVWTNPGEIAGNSIDDDGNGYVDDVHGYDFSGSWAGDPWGSPNEDSNPDVFAGDAACGDGDDNNLDGYADIGVAHGTMTSGCAACVMNNGSAFAGVAGQAKVAMARCMSAEGSGTEDMIAAAFEYARAIPADVLNSSLGGATAMPSIQTQMIANYNAGISMFCASGNSGANEMMYPAAYAQCLAVGGVKHDDSERTSISTYGSWLDCCSASGDLNEAQTALTEVVWSIYVASVAEANEDPEIEPGQAMIGGGAGTSFASPYAAGVGALIKSVAPALTPAQVYSQITGHCYDVAPAGFDTETGYGRIDIAASLADWNQSGAPSVGAGSGETAIARVLPNPFAGEVAIRLAGPRAGDAERVEIFDVEGRAVRTLAPAGGQARWDGLTGDGKDAGSGVFFYRLCYRDGSMSPAGKVVRVE
ncbi:MAG: S8 family serine peptidase [bacterium]